jgi:hypothetical protein
MAKSEQPGRKPTQSVYFVVNRRRNLGLTHFR